MHINISTWLLGTCSCIITCHHLSCLLCFRRKHVLLIQWIKCRAVRLFRIESIKTWATSVLENFFSKCMLGFRRKHVLLLRWVKPRSVRLFRIESMKTWLTIVFWKISSQNACYALEGNTFCWYNGLNPDL